MNEFIITEAGYVLRANNIVYDQQGNAIAMIYGNQILDARGRALGQIHGQHIFKGSDQYLGTLADAMRLFPNNSEIVAAAAWLASLKK